MNIEQFDSIVDCIDMDNIDKPAKRVKKQILSILLIYIKRLVERVKSIFYYDIPHNLGRLTFGAYLELSKAKTPSKIVRIICKDFGIESLTDDESISCYKLWSKELERVSAELQKTSAKTHQSAQSQAYWSEVTEHHPLPNELWLVDKLAQRFSLSYDAVLEMKVQEVIIALTIDCITTEYEDKMAQQHINQSKRR